ncbi:hypothetical protein B0T12DRAFT_501060 [Alternaria alternata]|nr:hypothetical protein B0T12DRAFT_501060 [Alternaria alternata]
MASAQHVIDPNADTIIILRSPGNPEYFALWDNSPFENLDALAQLPFCLAAEDVETTNTNDNTVHQAPTEGITVTSFEHTIPVVPVGSVLYCVSSRHLTLASPVFRKMLSPDGFREGYKKPDGRHYIVIPRRVSLELLAKVGILVDYYDCEDAVGSFTTTWMESFDSREVPSEYCRDLLLHLWVSYVFRDENHFQLATDVAAAYCDEGTLRTIGLPIPQEVSASIERRRTDSIEERISQITDNLYKYQFGQGACSIDEGSSVTCNFILYRYMWQMMWDMGLQWPSPTYPYHGFSAQQLQHYTHKPLHWGFGLEEEGDVVRHRRNCWSWPQMNHYDGPRLNDFPRRTFAE